jgi:hypothetical protein
MRELNSCNDGSVTRRISAAKLASAPIVGEWLFSLPETIALEVAGSIFAVSRTRCR